MSDANNKDNKVILPNPPAQATFLQYNREQATEGIDFSANANKKEFICFEQGEAGVYN